MNIRTFKNMVKQNEYSKDRICWRSDYIKLLTENKETLGIDNLTDDEIREVFWIQENVDKNTVPLYEETERILIVVKALNCKKTLSYLD